MLSLFSFLTGGWRLVNFISIEGAQLTIYHYNHEIAQSELVYWFFQKNILYLLPKTMVTLIMAYTLKLSIATI